MNGKWKYRVMRLTSNHESRITPSCLVTALLASNTTSLHDFFSFLYAGFAPPANLCNRSKATQANVILVEAAIANARRWHAADRFVAIKCHVGPSR
jgi:hypothetical protein